MVHLPPLPDYPESPGIEALVEHALADMRVLQECGVTAVLVENEYDRPHRIEASPETRAAMTRITTELVESGKDMRVGCEILLHDPNASLDVAKAAGADFIRVDYFVDRMRRDEYGEFAIDPDGLLEYRSSTGADAVLLLADIQVKYAEMIEPRPIVESARLAMQKGADAVVVTGTESGNPPRVEDLRAAAVGIPVLIGSGLHPDNASELLDACDGAIVGTAIMRDGRVDRDAVLALLSQVAGA